MPTEGRGTKLSALKSHMAAGRYEKALGIAAKFPRLGEHKVRITRAWAAHTNPEFYRDIGQSPEELFQDGINAVRERYGL